MRSQAIPIPFWYIDIHVKFQNPNWSESAATGPPFSHPKIQRIFKFYKEIFVQSGYSIILFLKKIEAKSDP